MLHFRSNYWKWYDDSDRAFNDLMAMAQKYDEEYACRFARVGEEIADLHEEAFGEYGWDLDFPYVVRTLEVGFDENHAKKLIED